MLSLQLLAAVRPLLTKSAPSAHAAHGVHRTAAAASAVQGDSARTKGIATPLFVSAAITAKAGAAAKAPLAAKSPAGPSAKFLRHEVQGVSKAAVKVAALAKSVKASKQSKADLVRARVAKVPLHTAMHMVETGAANSLAKADKDAVEAALLRAALSVPGQRKAEKAAAAAAARAAANKPSAAWLAGAKSLADRDPYAVMTSPQQQLRQQRGNMQRRGTRGRNNASLARAKRGALASHGRMSLSHTGYSADEDTAYVAQAGRHPIDVGGNDKIISTIHPNEDGEIERPDYNHPYVRKTKSLKTPVDPADVQRYWKNGEVHPYGIVKRDDRYVPVGRLLSHRGGVTRREMKMPTVEEEEEGGVDTQEEQPEEEEEEEASCEWGKDVYGRCYTECTPAKDDYSKCHDGTPIWHDPVPLSKLCKGHENATWCQEEDGEGEGDETAEEKARTVQLASIGGSSGEVLGGSAPTQNAANAPTLAGGVPVAGGKVVWLPLDSLTKSRAASGEVQQATNGANSFMTASTGAAAVTPEVPKWDPKVWTLQKNTSNSPRPANAQKERGKKQRRDSLIFSF